MASRSRGRESGFSLLELIIVLMIMVSLLAVAWPTLQRPLRRNSLSQGAQALRSAIDDCRYQAITTGSPVFVHMRQSDGVIEGGAFESFVDEAESLSDSRLSTASSLQPATIVRVTTSQSGSATSPRARRTWNLPPSVVIRNVSWTLDSSSSAPSDEIEGRDTQPSSIEAVAEVEVEAEASTQTELGQLNGDTQAEWWLPFTANGQGRDASIVLLDTSINEEMTVRYMSATGALEISR